MIKEGATLIFPPETRTPINRLFCVNAKKKLQKTNTFLLQGLKYLFNFHLLRATILLISICATT